MLGLFVVTGLREKRDIFVVLILCGADEGEGSIRVENRVRDREGGPASADERLGCCEQVV